METDTFGAAFGRLVKARRGKQWTQSALAAAMFPNQEDAGEKRKGDISKLESGKVANPNATTVTRIAEILDITEAEIDALRKQVQMSPQQQLDAVPTLSRNQLELLATRFELERAFDKSDGDLRSFLESKAEEFRSYKAQVDAIDERTAGLGNLKSAAQDAAINLDFDEVEMLLSRVQEAELEVAAETAELRARNALLRGRPEQAYALFTAAADSFAAVDPLEPARRRQTYQDLFFQYGNRYGGQGHLLMEKMVRGVLTLATEKNSPNLWGRARNSLAIALRNQGTRTAGPEGAALLAQAVDSYRAALRVRTEADEPVRWAMTMQNLAGALQQQGTRTAGPDGAALLGQAVDSYRAALRVRTEADHPVDWAQTIQNLGVALQDQGTRTAGPEGAALLAEAVDSYRAALRVYTEADEPVRWAITMQNLGIALKEQGTRTAGPDGAALLGQAVDSYRAALRVRTEADEPVRWAMTMQNLGNALGDQGKRTAGPQGAKLQIEAMSAYRSALQVRTKGDHPVQWAETQVNLAYTLEEMVDHDTCTDPRPHLEAGLAHVDAALTVFDPDHMPYYFEKATTLRNRLRARLEQCADEEK